MTTYGKEPKTGGLHVIHASHQIHPIRRSPPPPHTTIATIHQTEPPPTPQSQNATHRPATYNPHPIPIHISLPIRYTHTHFTYLPAVPLHSFLHKLAQHLTLPFTRRPFSQRQPRHTCRHPPSHERRTSQAQLLASVCGWRDTTGARFASGEKVATAMSHT